MTLTDSGKYAIRALVHLAARSDEELPVSAAAVAESEDIPPYYLAKVMHDLARAGLLRSVRGRGGGFALKNSADTIGVLEILAPVENVRRLTTECVLGLDQCNDEVPCCLHDNWKNFREMLLSNLSELTLADLVVELARKRGTPTKAG